MTSTCIYCGHFNKLNVFKTCPLANNSSCDPCMRARQLELKILEAKKALDELLEQHREIRVQMNHAHDPISLLPNEITSSIFEAYVPTIPSHDTSTRHEGVEHESSTTPWTIGAVCQKWRQIAWSAPRLWNVIDIDAEGPKLATHVEKLRKSLERAGQLPLAIRVRTQNLRLDECESLETIIQLLNEHSSQWARLDLRIPLFFLSNFRGGFQPTSILRALRLYSPSNSSLVVETFSLRNVKPRPKEIDLQHVAFSLVDIDWSEAMHTRFHCIKVEDCHELFRQAIAMKQCILSDVYVGGWEIPTPDAIQHGLEDLVIQSSDRSVDLLLERLGFPDLKSLTCDDFNFLPLNALSSLLQRSSCHLRELTITRTALTGDTLILFLKEIPSLEHLKLESGSRLSWSTKYSPNNFFNFLGTTAISTDKNPGDCFLPNLQFLRYTHWWGNIDWSYVPNIFGPLGGLQCTSRRPLHAVQIHVAEQNLGGEYTHLDRGTVLSTLDVLGSGLDLEIGDPITGMDLIKKSMKYNGIIRVE